MIQSNLLQINNMEAYFLGFRNNGNIDNDDDDDNNRNC